MAVNFTRPLGDIQGSTQSNRDRPAGRSNIGRVGEIQSDFECSKAGRRRESLSLFWWSKEKRALILPIMEGTPDNQPLR